MANYRAGVIGHTRRGDYGHGLDTVTLDMNEVELVAVADADTNGLDAAGKRLGVPREGLYRDYREMLRQARLDLVSVAPRWPDQHCNMVVAAAESGVRGIFCEKPLARTLQEADVMLDACERNDVKMTVAHQYRVHPLVTELRRHLQDGLIGSVKEIHGYGKQDSRGGGQDLMVLGTHVLDLMCFLFGPPRWVQACVLQDGRDAEPADVRPGDEEIGWILGDQLQATYGFDGALGTFFSRRGDNRYGARSMGVLIYGTEGALAFRDGHLLHYPHPCWTPVPSDEQWRVLAKPDADGMSANNRLLVRDLIEAFEGDREPISSGRDARWALEMILGVYAAHRHGRVRLPAANRAHPLEDWR